MAAKTKGRTEVELSSVEERVEVEEEPIVTFKTWIVVFISHPSNQV